MSWLSIAAAVARALGLLDWLERLVEHSKAVQEGREKQKADDVAAAQKDDQDARSIEDGNSRLSDDALNERLRNS